MPINLDTKTELLNQLNANLNTKMEAIKAAIADVSESMKNDTKSSAGDKFETGREMMQIELNNKQAQLGKLIRLKKDLALIQTKKKMDRIGFGSLVRTNQGNYFISVALGKVTINQDDFFAISLVSPLGQLLKDKEAGDSIQFNGRTLKVQEIL